MNLPKRSILRVNCTPEDLTTLLDELRQDFPQLKITGTITHTLHSDLIKLRLIFNNLIKNGFFYGKQVSMAIEESADKTTFIVQDQGPGVLSADQHKIFQEFYQSEATKHINQTGLGLGLYLAKKVSKEIGANIFLANPDQPHAMFKVDVMRAKKP